MALPSSPNHLQEVSFSPSLLYEPFYTSLAVSQNKSTEIYDLKMFLLKPSIWFTIKRYYYVLILRLLFFNATISAYTDAVV